MYKLYYYPRNASWVPHVVLEELGVPFELRLVNRAALQQKSEEYLKLNPSGRIPTLIDGENAIFESAAISLHLCEAHNHSTLLPSVGHPDRTGFYQWLFYLTGTVQPELMLYFYPEKHSSNLDCCIEVKTSQENRVTEMFALLDEHLNDRDLMVGNQVTLCDLYLFMLALWADGFERPPVSFENLRRVLRNVAKQPSVIKVCDVEGVNLQDYS